MVFKKRQIKKHPRYIASSASINPSQVLFPHHSSSHPNLQRLDRIWLPLIDASIFPLLTGGLSCFPTSLIHYTQYKKSYNVGLFIRYYLQSLKVKYLMTIYLILLYPKNYSLKLRLKLHLRISYFKISINIVHKKEPPRSVTPRYCLIITILQNWHKKRPTPVQGRF